MCLIDIAAVPMYLYGVVAGTMGDRHFFISSSPARLRIHEARRGASWLSSRGDPQCLVFAVGWQYKRLLANMWNQMTPPYH